MLHDIYLSHICSINYVVCHVTGKQLKLLSHETVHQNQIKPVVTEKALNSQKCLSTLYILGKFFILILMSWVFQVL